MVERYDRLLRPDPVIREQAAVARCTRESATPTWSYYSQLTIGSDNSILQVEYWTMSKMLSESFLDALAVFGVYERKKLVAWRVSF
jgi:hypothetical protein